MRDKKSITTMNNTHAHKASKNRIMNEMSILKHKILVYSFWHDIRSS